MPLSEFIVRINSKNRVTLPAAVRRRLGMSASDTVAFVLHDDGRVELRRAGLSLESVLGSIPALPGVSDDFDREIAEATAAEIERLGRRKL